MSTLFIFPPTKIDTTGLATEAGQQAQLAELQDINSNTDEMEAKQDETNAILTDIEADLITIAGYVDGLEAGQTAGNATLTSIDTSLNNVEADTLSMKLKTASSLVSEPHDYIALTYVGITTDIATATYKLGGAAGTLVATLTLGYDGSNRLTSVTRS